MSKQEKNSFAKPVTPLIWFLSRQHPKPEDKWRYWGHWGSIQIEEALAILCESVITNSTPQVLVHELTQQRKQIGRTSLLLHLYRYSFIGIPESQRDCLHDWSSTGDAQRLFGRGRPGMKLSSWVHEALSWEGWQASQELTGKGHNTGVCDSVLSHQVGLGMSVMCALSYQVRSGMT